MILAARIAAELATNLGETVGFSDELLDAPDQIDIGAAAAGERGETPGEDRADIGVARATRLPKLSATGGAGYNNNLNSIAAGSAKAWRNASRSSWLPASR